MHSSSEAMGLAQARAIQRIKAILKGYLPVFYTRVCTGEIYVFLIFAYEITDFKNNGIVLYLRFYVYSLVHE